MTNCIAICALLLSVGAIGGDWRADSLRKFGPSKPVMLKTFMQSRSKDTKVRDGSVAERKPVLFVGGDPRNIMIDQYGNETILPDPVLDESVKKEIKAMQDAFRTENIAKFRQVVRSVPGRVAKLVLDDFSYKSMESSFVHYAAILADLENDQASMQGYLRFVGTKDSGYLRDTFLPLYAAKAGIRSPELLEEMRSGISRRLYDAPSYFGGRMPDMRSNAVFYGEILAALRADCPWIEAVHARRAHSLYPMQAISARMLMREAIRKNDPETALRIGRGALKYASGEALESIKFWLREAEGLKYRQDRGGG